MAMTGDTPTANTRIEMRCPKCGGNEVLKDACASWNPDTQRWDLTCVYDHESCAACEYEGDFAFQRIDMETGAVSKPVLDEGFPSNCVTGTGHELAVDPATGNTVCRPCLDQTDGPFEPYTLPND